MPRSGRASSSTAAPLPLPGRRCSAASCVFASSTWPILTCAPRGCKRAPRGLIVREQDRPHSPFRNWRRIARGPFQRGSACPAIPPGRRRRRPAAARFRRREAVGRMRFHSTRMPGGRVPFRGARAPMPCAGTGTACAVSSRPSLRSCSRELRRAGRSRPRTRGPPRERAARAAGRCSRARLLRAPPPVAAPAALPNDNRVRAGTMVIRRNTKRSRAK